MGYLCLHVFYTESTIFLAPGCGENTSSTSGDRVAGTIGPWDWYQAVDSQQSYIRARFYIHGVTLSISPHTNYHGYPIWYCKVLIQTIVTPSLQYRWRAEPENQKVQQRGAKTGLHLIYTTATRPVRRCCYFTSYLLLWVTRFIMGRGGALGNGGEKVAPSLWGRRGGKDIAAARACPGGGNAHSSPELLFSTLLL